MKPVAQRIFKVILWLSYLAPLTIWVILSFTGGLGAEPIVKINSQSGYVTLILILINLGIGFLISAKVQWLKKIKWIISERRSLGITAGIYALFHFASYLGKEGFLPKAWEQIATKTYLIFGISAAGIVWILTITSNQFSVRILGIKRWKNLHRFIYLAGFLIMTHTLLIEKGNIPLLLTMMVPMVLLQLWRVYQWRKSI